MTLDAAFDDPRVGSSASEPRPGSGRALTLPPVEWRWNPWRERPARAAIALGFTLTAFALVMTLAGSAVLAVLLALSVGGLLAPLIVPSGCRIDESGIALRSAFGWERRAWAELRRARLGRDAVVMSPFSSPRRLDAFRALVLPIPAARREALLAAVRSHCDHHEL